MDEINRKFNALREEIIIKRNKYVDGLILGEIRKIATEYGIETTIVINEKAVANALRKAVPQKYVCNYAHWDNCPSCGEEIYVSASIGRMQEGKPFYCSCCGQKLVRGDK